MIAALWETATANKEAETPLAHRQCGLTFRARRIQHFKDGEITTEPYIPVHATITVDEDGNEAETWEGVNEETYPLTVKDEYGKIYHRVLVQDHKMYVAPSDYEEDPNYEGNKEQHR